MSEPYDVSTAADRARGRRVLCDRRGETWEVCDFCGAIPQCCICADESADDSDRDDLDHDRFPTYCAACGRDSDCLMNGLCGRCYECQGGVRLPGQ